MQQHAQDVRIRTLILKAEVIEAALKGFQSQCEAAGQGEDIKMIKRIL